MKRVALVVGIERYPKLPKINKEKPHLPKAAEEAEKMAKCLEEYGDFEVHRLPSREVKQESEPERRVRKLELEKAIKQTKRGVTQSELEKAIKQIFTPPEAMTPDTALLYFAGHGQQKQENGKYEGYLLTSNSRPNSSKKEQWGVSLKWLREILEESKVRQQIVWLDCCHSGEFFNFAETDLGTFFEKQQDRCLIAASREFEEAVDGLFTPKLLQGLNPDNSPDGWVTNVSLAESLEKALKDAPQHPIIRNPGGEILLIGKQGIKGNICPYKGLAYFDFNEEDAQYFYGRTALTEDLLEKVRSRSLVAVLGASGSGKSSVVRAGLLYQLQQDQQQKWTIYSPFTPGERPLRSLQQAVGVNLEQLKAVVKAAATERVILTIDQFEEVFTLCREVQERQQFLKGLFDAVNQLQGKLCVVVVMRSDFFGKLTEKAYGGFTKAIEQNLLTVQQMSEGELREAIVNPAEKVGVEIDRELVTQMIADVSGSPGNLPLMQYTLTQLWDEKTLNRLMLTDYTRLGGVTRALENHADGVYKLKLLSEQEKKVAKGIFLELTRLGEGTEDTRRQVYQQDLIHSPQLREVVEGVIQKLADAKLLVTGEVILAGKRVAVVNIAHEALIRHWELLGQWLRDNRAALLRKQEIEDAAREWRDKGKGKDKNYLLQGTRLAAAEDYQQRFGESVPLSNLAQKFVRRSVKHRQNSRRTLTATVSGVILGLAGLAGWALINATDAQIRADSSSSESLYASDRKLEALVAGLRAAKRLKSPLGMIGAKSDTRIQTITALREAVYGIQEINRFEGHDGPVLDVDVSPDGKLIASAGQDKTVKIWSQHGELLTSVKTSGTQETSDWEQIQSIAFSPDGKTIAFPQVNEIVLLDIQGKILKTLDYPGQEPSTAELGILNVKFSPNGKLLASTGADNNVHLRTVEGNLIAILSHKGGVNDVAFSHNQKRLATASVDGIIRIWNYQGSLLQEIKHTTTGVIDTKKNSVTSIDFSTNGELLTSASRDGTVKLWHPDGSLIRTIKAYDSEVKTVNFNLEGNLIVSADNDGIVKLWNLEGKLIKVFTGHTGAINQSFFSYRNLITAGNDGTIRFWKSSIFLKKIFSDNLRIIADMEFHPNGNSLITSSQQGIILYNLETDNIIIFENSNNKPNPFYREDSFYQERSVSFSPDGQFVIASNNLYDSFGIWKSNGKLLKIVNQSKDNFGFELFESLREVQFSNNGKFIVSAGKRALEVWETSQVLKNAQKPKSIININSHNDFNEVTYKNLSVSQDSQMIAAYQSPNTKVYIGDARLKIWDFRGNEISTLDGQKSTFSYDSKTILTAGEDAILRLYDLKGELVKTATGHSQVITDITFSPNNQMIASSSEDKTVKIWNRDGTLIETLEHDESVTALAFSPDSKTLAAALDNGQVILWNLDINDLLARGCDKIQNYLQNNPNVAPEDKKLCNGVPAPKNN